MTLFNAHWHTNTGAFLFAYIIQMKVIVFNSDEIESTMVCYAFSPIAAAFTCTYNAMVIVCTLYCVVKICFVFPFVARMFVCWLLSQESKRSGTQKQSSVMWNTLETKSVHYLSTHINCQTNNTTYTKRLQANNFLSNNVKCTRTKQLKKKTHES